MVEIEERRNRVEAIKSIFSDIHYKFPEEKDAAILSFVKATNLTIEEIEKMMAPGRSDYLNDQLTKRGIA